MQLRFSVRDEDGFGRDVRVDAPAGTALADVVNDLAAALPGPTGTNVAFWSDGRRLPQSALLGGPGLRDGAVLQLGQAPARDLATGAVFRVHVVGGPDAGTVVALPRGVLTIGRARDCDLVLTDADASRVHASVTVTNAGITLRDLDSTNGTRVEGHEVDADGSSIRPGQVVQIGESRLCVAGADEPAAAARAGPDGTRLVNRPPRLGAPPPVREIAVPSRTTHGGPQRIHWLAALLPAATGAVLAGVLHNAMFLAFALMSPVLMIGTAAGDRLHWRRDRRRDAVSFRARTAAAAAECAALLEQELGYRRRAHPDPAANLRTAAIPDCRLWERRRRDPDFLDIRLGLGDVPSSVRTRRGSDIAPAGMLHCVPVTVSLRPGALGVAGPRGVALGTARWLVAQLATLHSPADLELALLVSDDAGQAWTWARWLPHLRGRVAARCDERHAMVADLARLVEQRLADRKLDPGGWTGRWTVLVVDSCGELADVAGLARVLAAGPAAGVTAICIDEEERRLPTACAAVVSVRGETGTRVATRLAGGTELSQAIADRVSTRWAERVARSLAPLRDAGADAASAIPGSCRLLELIGLDDPAPPAVLARWQSGTGTAVPIGMGVDGSVVLDLVRDGPRLSPGPPARASRSCSSRSSPGLPPGATPARSRSSSSTTRAGPPSPTVPGCRTP